MEEKDKQWKKIVGAHLLQFASQKHLQTCKTQVQDAARRTKENFNLKDLEFRSKLKQWQDWSRALLLLGGRTTWLQRTLLSWLTRATLHVVEETIQNHSKSAEHGMAFHLCMLLPTEPETEIQKFHITEVFRNAITQLLSRRKAVLRRQSQAATFQNALTPETTPKTGGPSELDQAVNGLIAVARWYEQVALIFDRLDESTFCFGGLKRLLTAIRKSKARIRVFVSFEDNRPVLSDSCDRKDLADALGEENGCFEVLDQIQGLSNHKS